MSSSPWTSPEPEPGTAPVRIKTRSVGKYGLPLTGPGRRPEERLDFRARILGRLRIEGASIGGRAGAGAFSSALSLEELQWPKTITISWD